MNTIALNLAQVREQIMSVAQDYARCSEEITLVAVSKTKSVMEITQAIEAGQRAFGENYVQEALEKIAYFASAGVTELEWHFIGSLQSNKSRIVAEHFHWCHTVDNFRLASRLSEQRPAHLPVLNVLIQVNISDENSKSGVALAMLDELAEQVSGLENLCFRGLMAIPAPQTAYEKQFAVAQQMAVAFARLKTRYHSVDTLSLGMSGDMQASIAAGSTMVRIGTAIFGTRD